MNKKQRPKFILTVALVTVLLLANLIYHQVTGRPPVTGAEYSLNPIQRLGYALNGQVEKTIDFYFRFDEVQKENEDLKKQLADSAEKVRSFDQVKQENEQLKAMFQYKDRHDAYDYVGTNVINRSMAGLTPIYTLDKGAKDGVKEGMVVITYEGLAGQITEVYPGHSILETVVSENIRVSVVSAGSKTNEGILSGTTILGRSNLAIITELSLEAPLKKGDDMVTSGIGGFYPPDIYVGKIESVSEDPGRLMKSAVVIPKVRFTGNEQFFIVLPKNAEEVTY